MKIPRTQPAARRRRIGLGDESGVAITEFALVLPILALLLFGMMEFGRAINYWIDATHLANETARWAVVNQNPGSGLVPAQTLQQYIKDQATTNELRAGGTGSVPVGIAVTICFPSGTAVVGQPVRAKASVTYHWLPFIGNSIGVGSTTITGRADMRLEALPTNYTADAGPC
jgi:Flp pilus assembly protein TadG